VSNDQTDKPGRTKETSPKASGRDGARERGYGVVRMERNQLRKQKMIERGRQLDEIFKDGPITDPIKLANLKALWKESIRGGYCN
jgi:hypothetical protein